MEAATVGIVGQQGQQNPNGTDAMKSLNMDDFLAMMIAELQNQDPLNPMDNTQMLQQIAQIREIASNDRLTDTLEAVTLGQNLASANSLVGRFVVARSAGGSEVTGLVDRISIADGKPKVHVRGYEIDLKNIEEIFSESTDTMIGRFVVGTNASNERVAGIVDGVTIEDGVTRLNVDGQVVDLDRVTQILSESADGMAGRLIVADTSDGQTVAGLVDRVANVDGAPVACVRNYRIDLNDIAELISLEDDSLVGRTITGLTDEDTWITGEVDRISRLNNTVTLIVKGQSVAPQNVTEILAD